MKDYSKMSDFEINKAVAACLGVEVQEWNGKIFGGVERSIDNVTSVVGVIDYCNNPSDAWPIIHGNDIMLNPNCADELWKAEQGFREKPSGFYGVATAYNKNPLRAAMIVYLMMKDEEK